jgi:hypothetical protein
MDWGTPANNHIIGNRIERTVTRRCCDGVSQFNENVL